MCSVTLIAEQTMMATTRFMGTVGKVCWPHREQNVQHQRPRMNWVVVTDETGQCRLQMGWHADRDS